MITVRTTLKKYPIEIPKDVSPFRRLPLIMVRKQQPQIWLTVCRYFAEGNGFIWEEFKEQLGDDSVCGFEYEAVDLADAQRELKTIEKESFKGIGEEQMRKMKTRFMGKKKVLDSDCHPNWERLTSVLLASGIFLTVEINEEK